MSALDVRPALRDLVPEDATLMSDTPKSTLHLLVERLDESVRLGEIEAVTGHVKAALTGLIRSGSLEIPERFCRPLPDRYARRLLHRDEKLGYTAVLMTWGPGQGTLLHDHGGFWCVEAVVSGEMDVFRYDLLGEEGGRFRFARVEQLRAGVGTAGALIPPYEYHVLRNALADRASVTLHVYGGDMVRCSIFEPSGEGLWVRHDRPLGYDD